MSATATVTGKTGPGVTVTAAVTSAVTGVQIDIENKVLRLFQSGIDGTPAKEYELTGSTFTVTISSGAISAISAS